MTGSIPTLRELVHDVPGHAARRWFLLTAALVMLLVIVWGIALSNERQADDPRVSAVAASPGSPSGEMTQQERDAAWAEAMTLRASGWERFGVHPYYAGTAIPETAWVEADWQFEPPEFRAPVFDAPDGRVIGYYYSNLDYLTVDQAVTFDAVAARIDRYGCDIEMDVECHSRLLDGLGATE